MTAETRHFAIAVLGIAILTAMDAIAKALAEDFGTFQIVFMRFAVAFAWLVAFIPWTRPAWPRRERMPAHVLRACLAIVTNATFFYALGRLPLAEVFALTYTGPIFVALFGALLLKEKVRWPTAVAIACGFAGVLVIGSGGAGLGDGDKPVEWLALACAVGSPVTYALSIVLLRSQTAHEGVTTILIVQSALIPLLLLPIFGATFRLPAAEDLLPIAGLGLLAALGLSAFSYAISKLPAAQVAVADYSGLLWAALIGWFVFAEMPRPALALGAVLILAGSATMLLARKKPDTADPQPK